MNTKIELLAMDFDGVIADSIMECAVVANNGYANHNGIANHIISPKELDPSHLDKFIQTRPYIRSGEDYIYLFQSIYDDVKINNQEDFDNFKNKYIELTDLYYKLFYSYRNRLLKDHYSEWMSLNPLFKGMDRFLNIVLEKLHIISTKSSRYILSILSHNNIRINQENIHSTENGQSKANILLDIMEKNNISYTNTVYIDDHLGTLIGMQVTKTICLLAAWGYNNENQYKIAEDSNIEMIGLNQFYKKYGMR